MIGIVQSSYIPWKGFFDLLGLVDALVLFDDAQYTRRDWRNRNRIKGQHGAFWLTIPVHVAGRRHQRIRDVRVVDDTWRRKHWRSLRHAYHHSPHFDRYEPVLRDLYLERSERSLSEINRSFVEAVANLLGITTPLCWSHELRLVTGRTERLLDICRQLGARTYLSGPSARSYLDVEKFSAAGIDVRWMDYSDYPEYAQPHPPFLHEVSVLDLLFAEGPAASRHMKFSGDGSECTHA